MQVWLLVNASFIQKTNNTNKASKQQNFTGKSKNYGFIALK